MYKKKFLKVGFSNLEHMVFKPPPPPLGQIAFQLTLDDYLSVLK